MTRFRSCVLVGLPGAGKTTIGREVARRLRWRFVDVDEEIERRTGRTIADLFQADGEPAFRAMEFRLTAELSSQADTVLVPGGGWAAQPAALESIPADSAVVWLRVMPQNALQRLTRDGLQTRPLLAGADPLGMLERLSAQRYEYYERAALVIDVDDAGIDDISRTIGEWLRQSTS